MRTMKIVLVLLFAAVSLVFCFSGIRQRMSGKDEGPEITCEWEVMDVSVDAQDQELLAGITAWDPQDGDLTDKVLVGGVSKLLTENTAKITYLVFDSDDNMGTMVRYLRYTDYRRPVFEITKPLVYGTGGAVQPLSRLKAYDILDGDISQSVRISTLRGTDEKNIYSATAQVTNSLGDTARVELPVILRDSAADLPEIRLKRQMLYLNRGDAFDPQQYLISVNTENGPGSISDVKIQNPVDTSVPDTYWVRYTCTNGSRTGIAIMVVVVV